MSDLRDQLAVIYKAHGGELKPKFVVDAARPVRHPLHNRFEWDDRKAGERFRLVQAQELIRSVDISYVDPKGRKKNVRQWWSVDRPTGTAYQPLETVVDDPFTRELVLRQAERDWRELKERYGHLQEFIAMVKRDVA